MECVLLLETPLIPDAYCEADFKTELLTLNLVQEGLYYKGPLKQAAQEKPL